MYKAIRKNPSAPQAAEQILTALRDIPVSALSDNMHRNIGSVGLHPYQRPGKKTMAGTAVTVRSRGGDNLTYLRALEFCRPGDVLVVDAGGDLNNAGDIVVGDQDGLLAIAQDDAEHVIEKALAVLEAEAETMWAMKEGRWNRAFIDALEARCNN
jgi:regulator of RNase E activity RraA